MDDKRVIVKNHQGQIRNAAPVDLPMWAKRGYFPEKEKEVKAKKKEAKAKHEVKNG